MGINYLADGGEDEVITLKGSLNNSSDNLTFFYLGGSSPHYSIDQLEADGGELLFKSEDGFGRIYVNETENYKVISTSTMLGAMANGDSLNLKPYILSEIVNYFMDYNPVTSLHSTLDRLMSGKSFPNPFAGVTHIEFNISQPGWVTVDIYNTNGQSIKRLKNEELKPGSYQVSWDATDKTGTNVEDGFYFYTITTGQSTVSGKLILLR
ncbi:MAG: T9SS type A sorting domain-containing protein [Bacteroidales bacterium]